MTPAVKTTSLLTLLGFSLALNLSQAIGTSSGPGPGAREPAAAGGSSGACLVEQLELDAGQEEQLAELRAAMQLRRTDYWQRCAELKRRLADAICAPGASGEALAPILEEYSRNQAEMQRAVAEHLLEVRALLDEAQRGAFRGLLAAEIFRGIRSLPGGMAEGR